MNTNAELAGLTKFNQEDPEEMMNERLTAARKALAKISIGEYGEASLIASECLELINYDD